MPDRAVSFRFAGALRAFHESAAFVRGVMGPVGSGKSSAMCAELLHRAGEQPPGPDGVRRTRFAVIRNTYPELRTTTLKTWKDWVPEEVCPVSAAAPMSGRMRETLRDGTRLDMEVLFLALDRADDERKLLSLELTGAWVNEAREVRKPIIDGLTGRVGRYPPLREGGPAWSGVIMDTNPPDRDHWWYRLAEEQRPEGWAFFRQPPALLARGDGWAANPAAENLDNQPLGAAYWLRQAAGKRRDWIDVYLLGRYGQVADGAAVYPEYDDARHLAASDLAPLPGVPLTLGWDFGLTPACVVAQLDPRGRLLILDELAGESVGIRRFVHGAVLPALRGRYKGLRFESWGDPAGSARAQTDERTCMEELAAAGIPTRPARTNEFLARREAVAGFLARADEPGLILSPRCTLLRKGFLGAYRFERLSATGSEERHAERPEKNRSSHIHDALQYAALAAEGPPAKPARPRTRRRPGGADYRPADVVAGY